MTLHLHLWNRRTGAYESIVAETIGAVWSAWRSKPRYNHVGVVVLDSEASPVIPDKETYGYDPLLASKSVADRWGSSIRLGTAFETAGSSLHVMTGMRKALLSDNQSSDASSGPTIRRSRTAYPSGVTGKRYPSWFSQLPLSEVLDADTSGRFSAVGVHTVREIVNYRQSTFGEPASFSMVDFHRVKFQLDEELKRRNSAASKSYRDSLGYIGQKGEHRNVPFVDIYAAAIQDAKFTHLADHIPVDLQTDPKPVADISYFKSPRIPTPETKGSLLSKVKESLRLLPPRNRKIVALRLGVGCEPLSLRATADHFGLSGTMVRFVEKSSISKISRSYDWPDHLITLVEGGYPISLAKALSHVRLSGFDADGLARLMRFALSRRLYVIQVKGEEYIGPIAKDAWAKAVIRVHALTMGISIDLDPARLRVACASAMTPEERPYLDLMAQEVSILMRSTKNGDATGFYVGAIRNLLRESASPVTEVGIRGSLSALMPASVDPTMIDAALGAFIPFQGKRRGLSHHILTLDDFRHAIESLPDGHSLPPERRHALDPLDRSLIHAAWPKASIAEVRAERSKALFEHRGEWSWDADKETILRDMWAEGVSTKDIAAELSTTKGSVMGRLNRLGLLRKQGQDSPHRQP